MTIHAHVEYVPPKTWRQFEELCADTFAADWSGVFEGQPIIPDHKMLFIDCKREEEAYFLAGVLNSIPARCALYSAFVGVQTQSYYPPDISRIRLSAFDPQSKTVALPTKNGVKQNRSTPEQTCTVNGVLRSRSFYPPLVPPRDT
jgi:hypothetical protein